MNPGQTSKPVLAYDGQCAFCIACVEYGKRLTGERVAYAPFQAVAASFPQIPVERFKEAVQLILPGGEVLNGAHAVLWTVAVAKPGLLWAYEHIPGFAWLAEAVYRFVARRRDFLASLLVRRA